MCFEASWKVVLAFSLQKKGAHNRFIFIFFLARLYALAEMSATLVVQLLWCWILGKQDG